MKYRIQSNGAVATQGEVRKMFPNTSLPRVWNEALCTSLGMEPILEGAQATGGTVYQMSVYGGIEQIEGKWFTKYNLGPAFFDTEDEEGIVTTAAENEVAYKAIKDAEQAKSVRASRDTKLAECDWTACSDVTMPEAMTTYRQALRDITTQDGFPWTTEWPTQPE